MAAIAPVVLGVDGNAVSVSGGQSLIDDARARRYFEAILGCARTAEGWRCPVRRTSAGELAVRINSFLQSKGWITRAIGIADESIQRDLERGRSFQRSREAAARFRAGQTDVDLEVVRARLREVGWSDAQRALKPHQEQAVLHALSVSNAANFSVPGSGKTAATLAVAAIQMAAKNVSLILVVGPLSSFRPWEVETTAALGALVRPRRIRGPKQRRADLYARAQPTDLLLVSYATAAADQQQLIELCQRYRVMLVVDESHRIKRFRGGVWAPALARISRHAAVRIVLTGTPIPQGARDLYSQLSILWPGGELTGPRAGFASRVDTNLAGVIDSVAPFTLRTPKSALGLPEYIVTFQGVPLGGTQREIYLLIEDRFRQRLLDAATWRQKIEVLRRGRPIRLLQAASNPGLLNRDDPMLGLPRIERAGTTLMERLATYDAHEEPAKSVAALELVKSIVEAGAKVVCWSNFVANLDHFARLVAGRLNVPVFQIDGRVPVGDEPWDDKPGTPSPLDRDTRERVIERFLAAPGAAVLVTNPASISESISLHHGCYRAIYLDRTYDCALFLQSVDRIHRLGLPPDITVEITVLEATLDGRSTIDGLASASLRQKQALMDRVLEGAELTPANLERDALRAAEGDQRDLEELLAFLLGRDEDGDR